jgi:hypothetical protein
MRDYTPSDASIITAFCQGVRHERMLEKLATHDVETVTTLFALADKCARAAEGRAWHSAPQTGVTQTGGSGVVAQDGKKKKLKTGVTHERPPSAAPIVAAATGGWSERSKRPRPQGGNSGSCHVHPNSFHSTAECREIIKFAKRVSVRHEQSSKDGSPPRRRPGKERVDDGEVAAGERDLGYQSPEGDLKDVFTGDSNSGDDNDHLKKLYVMYGGSWKLTSRRNVKSLCRDVLSATRRNVQFDVVEVNLPFNAIIGRPAQYRFLAIAHYEYLVLKMLSPARVLTVRGNRATALAAVVNLHALAAEAARPDDGGRNPSTSGTKVLKVRPCRADDVPVKAI